MFKTKVTVPAGDTSFLSITKTVWVIISLKYMYEMNIFYGEDIDKICLNVLTHVALVKTVMLLIGLNIEDKVKLQLVTAFTKHLSMPSP